MSRDREEKPCQSGCTAFMATSLDDLKSSYFWRALLAEALGTLFLVFIGCGTCLGGQEWETYNPTMVQISLSFGLAVATMVWCIAHLSGGHINPAVTVAMLLSRRISIARAVLYVVAQCAGAIAGAGILKGLTPAALQGTLGLTNIDRSLTVEQGFGIEFMVTFVLVLTVFACCDSKRTDLNGSAPLTIGLTVTLCHLFAIKYTGSSMNPARSFGPAVVTGIWENHWVYWCGPVLGGVVGGLIYDLIFASDASAAKLKHFILTSSVDTSGGGSSSRSNHEHEGEGGSGAHDRRYQLTEKQYEMDEKEQLRIVECEAAV